MKKAFIQLHMAILLAGCSGILGNLISLDAVLITWYRMLLAGLMLIIILYIKGNKPIIQKNEWRELSVGLLLSVSTLHVRWYKICQRALWFNTNLYRIYGIWFGFCIANGRKARFYTKSNRWHEVNAPSLVEYIRMIGNNLGTSPIKRKS